MDLAEYQERVYEINVANGWRGNPECPDPSFDEAMMLLLTEISEAADAWRKWGLADRTMTRALDWNADGTSFRHGMPKPEGVGSEFADILIRLLDDCHLFRCEIITPQRQWVPEKGADTPFLRAMFDLCAIVHKAERSWRRRGQYGTSHWLSELYRHLCGYAVAYGIDLQAETDRKLSYNRTRGYRHGGKRA